MSAESELQLGRNNGTDRPGVDYRALFEAMPGLYTVVLPDNPYFTIEVANDAWLQAIGKSREEIVGSSLFEVVPEGPDPAHAATLENLRASFRRVLVTRQPDTMPVQRYGLSRPESEGGGLEERYWSPVNSPVLGADGEVTHIIHRVENVTARRQVEEALRASEQESRRLEAEREKQLETFDVVLARLQEFVYLFDREGRFRYVNQPLLDLWGLTREEAVGKGFAELGYPDELVRLHEEQIRRVVQTAQPVDGDNFYTSPTGVTGHYEYTFVPLLAPDGSVESVGGHTRDVTGRRRVEAALRASEAKYRTLFESIDEGFCIIELLFNADGTAHDYRFLEANPAFEKQSGLMGAMGRTMRELVPSIEPSWAELYGQVALTGESTRFDANVESMGRWFDIYAFRIGEPHECQVAVLFTDITAKKAAEAERQRLLQQVRAERQRLEQVFAQAPVAVVVFRGPEFVIELANPFYHDLVQGRELVGRRFADIVPELGSEVWAAFHHVMNTGEPYVRDDFYVPYDQDGDGVVEDHWFNVVLHPLREANGVPSGLVTVCTEVTAQVRARQELERVNRGLEEFAHVASHDLQEPLRMVHAYSELLVRRLGLAATDEQREFAGFIQGGVKRMEQLIRDLLSYSRTVHTAGELAVSQASLEEALGHALTAVEPHVSETGATITHEPLPTVRGDTTQLAHVFQNLLSNALKYRKPDGPPEVHISARRQEGEWVISFRDNGIGFDPGQAERIFGLFKRLHRDDEYPGTGLGLAICKRIIERYCGRMWAESEPGVGSTFFFSLPVVP